MAMTVMKVIEKAFPFAHSSAKVNGQHASAGLQNPGYLDRQPLARFFGQMMKHHSGQHYVELRIGKGQRLGKRCLENHSDAGLSRLLLRPGNHLRRGVNSIYSASWPDLPFGYNGKASGTAAHVQD